MFVVLGTKDQILPLCPAADKMQQLQGRGEVHVSISGHRELTFTLETGNWHWPGKDGIERRADLGILVTWMHTYDTCVPFGPFDK